MHEPSAPPSPATETKNERIQASLDAVGLGTFSWDIPSGVLECDDNLVKLVGLAPNVPQSVQSLALAVILDDRAAVVEAFDRCAREGADLEIELRCADDAGRVRWIACRGRTSVDARGASTAVRGVCIEVTQRKQTEEGSRESSERLHLALAAGQLGDWIWSAATDGVVFSDRAYEIFGLTIGEAITWTSLRDYLHEEDRERARIAVENALATRTDYDIEYRVRKPSGQLAWVAARGRGTYTTAGGVVGMIGVIQDITARVQAGEALRDREQSALREEARFLEVIHTTGARLTAQLDVRSLLQMVTDAATELSGAKFGAFFYNMTDENGDAYQLVTLAGAPLEAFQRLGHPRATPIFAPTFKGEQGVIRFDDVRKEAHYGQWAPHHGTPPGHLPVRSYLAVPVVARDGQVFGGLFFGHPEVGVFTEKSGRIVAAVAAQASIAIDNARLYEAAQRASEERLKLLESERFARTQAERMSAMKDEFLAVLSHELRTPLSAILGWAQVMRHRAGNANADLAKGLEIIERNARAQTQLIEDLLDMSRIVSGKLRLEVQAISPHGFIEAAIESVRPAASAKGIRLDVLLDSSAGPIAGDAGRLQQVMWNLLSNAIKFTPRGGRVQVLLERVNSQIEISVADTGSGIHPDFLAHVFERFRQADASTTRKHGGLGLGLAIVKHLAELHGGSVLATSPGENRGATFTIKLPLMAAHRADGETRLHPGAESLGAVDFKALDLGGLTLVVVDDEPDARLLVARVLEECGARVFAASGAAEALELVERERPAVLVTDIGMPDVDGFQLLRMVRALGEARGGRVPAIALTAFARSEDRTRALSAGFLVHLSKPVEPSELVATIASVAGRTG